MSPIVIQTLRRVWRVECEPESQEFEFLRVEPDNAPCVLETTTLYVRRVDPLWNVELPGGRVIAGSARWLAQEIDAFVLRQAMMAEADAAALRAVALVSPRGERVALVGPARCGKTWLGIELALRGWTLDSDGVLFVGLQGARMHPRPFRLRDCWRGLPAQWRPFLEQAPRVEADVGWEVRSFDPRPIGGGWSLGAGPLSRVFFPHFNSGGRSALRRISVADAFRSSMAVNLGRPTGRAIAALYHTLSAAHLYELRFGASAGAANLIEETCRAATASRCLPSPSSRPTA